MKERFEMHSKELSMAMKLLSVAANEVAENLRNNVKTFKFSIMDFNDIIKETQVYGLDKFIITLRYKKYGTYYYLEFTAGDLPSVEDASFGRLLAKAKLSESHAAEIIRTVFGDTSAMKDFNQFKTDNK